MDQFWYVSVGVAALAFIFLLLKNMSENAKKKKAETEEARRQWDIQEHERKMARISSLSQMGTLRSQCEKAIDRLPKHLINAEKTILKAQREFEESAFSPFWDAVADAMRCLANFDKDVEQLSKNKRDYDRLILAEQNDEPWSFSTSILPDPRYTSSRLYEVIRNAQKDFQFASIYEQKRTNELLIHGFKTLGDAIDNMGGRIEQAIINLESSLEYTFAEQNDFLRDMSHNLGSASDDLSDISLELYKFRRGE